MAPPQGGVDARNKCHGGATRQWDLRQCVVSLDYWILWTSMYIGIGSGFTFLNNLGECLPPRFSPWCIAAKTT